MAGSSPSEQVAALAEAFVDRYRRGERPSIGEYADRHPDLAGEIREVFPAVALMENIALDREPPPPPPPAVGRVGDFRIVREIGRGGMGVVYEAEQLSLGRYVALKLLPGHTAASDRQRERFLREAKAAAKLHHTNIVPVFGFGEADGVPYYAMQYIRGQGLDAVVAELRARAAGRPVSRTLAADLSRSLTADTFAPPADATPPAPPGSGGGLSLSGDAARAGRGALWQGVARVGRQVAAALDHAHGLGVVHRDVKPSNLLLDVHGTAWVTDFGLAKAEGQPDLTRDGDVLGTLRYLPPEALDGKADARGDVFALGLCLYELLALRPAYDAVDQSGLVRQVLAADPPPLRAVVPSLPRDLATVVHKAIQKEPDRRYRTAAALADDLGRWLDGRPIAARPVSALGYAWRACKRNPWAAGMAAAAALALAAGVAAALWGRAAAVANARDANDQRERAERNERAATDERDRAGRNEAAALATAADLRRERDEVRRLTGELADRLHIADMNRGRMLLDGGNARAANALLARYRPAPDEPDRRGFEWYYLNRLANAEAEVVPLRHPPGLNSTGRVVAFSPDGRFLAFGTTGELRLRATADGTDRDLALPPGTEVVRTVAFTPDGELLVAATDREGGGEILAWDTRTGRPVGSARLVGVQPRKSLALSPAGDRLYVPCTDRVVRVYDPRTFAEVDVLRGHTQDVMSVAAGPGGEWVVSGSMDGNVRLWPGGRGGGARVLCRTGSPADDIVVRPDGGQMATVGWDGEVRVWDLTAAPPRVVFGRTLNVTRVAYSPDAKTLAAATWEGMVRFLDPATGAEVGRVCGHTRRSVAVAYSPDGERLATMGDDSTVRLWNLGGVADGRVVRMPDGVRSVAISPDGKTVVGCALARDPNLRVFDADTGRAAHVIPAHAKQAICRVRFSPDGRLLASVGNDGAVAVWDAATWAREPVWSAPVLPKRPEGQGYHIGTSDVDFSPDGSRLLVGTWVGGLVREYDARTGRPLRGWELPIDGGGRQWTVTTGYGVWHVRYSPDATKVIATAWARDTGRDFALVWDVTGERPRELYRVVVPDMSIGVAAFSPDGKELATAVAQDGSVRFWHPATGAPLAKRLNGHGSTLHALAYTADGRRVVTGSLDRTVRVWDAARGEELLGLTGHTNIVWDVSVSPDQTRIASCSSDGTIRVWDAPRK